MIISIKYMRYSRLIRDLQNIEHAMKKIYDMKSLIFLY